MILEQIVGDPDRTELPHRILNLLVFWGLLQAGYFLVSDTLVGQPYYFCLFDSVMIVFFALLYRAVRFKGRFFPGNHIFAIAGVVLPAFNFLVNAGINGPGLMVILVILILLNILHPGRVGLVYTVVGLALAALGLVVQFVVPGFVTGYRSAAVRFLDIFLTFFLCLVTMVFVIRMVMRFHSETSERSNRLQAAAAQSERMAALGEMVASISHEIGTPVGVMGASVGMTRGWWKEELPRFRSLWDRLSSDQRDAFWSFLDAGLRASEGQNPDSRSGRARREFLTAQLTHLGLARRRVVAEDLATLNLSAWDPAWDPLTADATGWEAWEFLMRAVSLDRSNLLASKAYDRIQRLVSSLGTYSRSGVPEEAPAPTSLSEGLDTVLTLYATAHKASVEIVRDFQEVPPVLAKAEDLVQVWTNLVQNALQAMGHRGTLTVRLSRRDPWAVVTIDDTGPGIPPESRQKIFQLFFTTKKRGSGTGLGLGIVQKIVLAHGGRIEVGEAPGGGARFEVFLPLGPSQP